MWIINLNMKKLNLHLVSESSGQTVKHAANTAISKFSDVEFKRYHWPMTRNEKLLNDVFEKIQKKPGVIIYTISNDNLRKKLKQFCYEQKIPCISVVSKIIRGLSEYLGVGTSDYLNRANKFDDSYFDKVDAIDYALRHDDGQIIDNLEEADILLIGPSRTSKTPTSVYLAYNGFKTANIPFIYNMQFPEEIFKLKHPIVFGLIINPSRLIEIRESRMNLLQINDNSNYTDVNIAEQECRQVRRLCARNNWLTIDVSSRSIEETAALIMKHYYEIKTARR